jgi:ABC-2 type transport system permease protein
MSLRVINANLIVSIKSFYREKTAVFFRVAFPVLLILVFGTIFMNQDNVRYDFYMQDLDHTNSSAELIKTLDNNKNFKIVMVDPNLDAAQYARKFPKTMKVCSYRG